MLCNRVNDRLVLEEADRFEAVLARLQKAPAPDAVLCDIDMPDLGPDRHIGEVIRTAGPTPVIIVTANDEANYVATARAFGARGFVSKGDVFGTLLAAVNAVTAGGTYFPAQNEDAGAEARALSQTGDKVGLTPKETLVLMGLAKGLSNKAIAREQGVSENAIKIHVRNIFAKLGVHNRTQAAMRASQIFFGTDGKATPLMPVS